MAEEAFALSPISARAAQPSEEDYDAISAAFMETSRGRWFLTEYAKRNRNADTRMVLDAVARIEESLAAQRQPPPDIGLSAALADIRDAVDRAEATASITVGSIATEEGLAPIRKGARIIREISWRWREIGADGRICDLIDSQVSAIEGACGHIASSSPQAALRATFDLIRAEIAEFDAIDADAPQAAVEPVRYPSQAPSDEIEAEAERAAQQLSLAAGPEAAPGAAPMPVEAVFAMDEVADTGSEEAHATAEAVDVTVEEAQETDEAAEAADAHDEAVLDLIALEMAAPDPEPIDETPEVEHHGAAVTPSEPAMVARAEPVVVSVVGLIKVTETPATVAPVAVAAPVVQPLPQASPKPSLGSALIANGILRSREPSQPDPLAPIRRLSQIEKIALFS
jgi:hypothetical protein